MIKKALLVIVTAIYLIIAIFAAYISINKIIDRYSVEKGTVEFFKRGRINLLIEDQLIKTSYPPVIEGNEIFLPYDIVKKYIDSTIYKETNGSVVTIISGDKVIRMRTDNLQVFINMEPVQMDLTARYINRVLYVPIIAFGDIFEIEASYNKKNNVVIIDYLKNYEHSGFVTPYIDTEVKKMNGRKANKDKLALKTVAVRKGRSVKERIYTEIGPEGEKVDVYEVNGTWAKIRTSEGIVGYVEARYLTSSVNYKGITVNLIRKKPDDLDKIALAWQFIYKVTPSIEKFMEYDQINVYSPTWFSVIDAEGTLKNKADMSYVEKVHELGARVWPLVSNTFSDIDMTSAVLNNPDARDNIYRQIISYVQLYDFDGINLDFENLYLKDKDAYTQFVRELMPYAREIGIKVSVDVGIPGGSNNYSRCYDHEKLSEEADYIMVMTYDQYWHSSPVAGSQAQLSWVSDMLELTLKYVNPEKLLVGIPMYTRMWRETDGVVKNFKTLGIDATKKYLEEKNAQIIWDRESGQYFAVFSEEGSLYKMWIEEERSIALKAGLVKKFGLKGVAVWQLSLGNEDAWKRIGESLAER